MKKILKSIGFVALYILSYFVASFIIGIAIGIFLVIKLIGSRQLSYEIAATVQNEVARYTYLILLGTSIGAFLILWLIFIIRKKSLFGTCSFKKINIKAVGSLLAAGIGLNFLFTYIISIMTEYTSLGNFVSDYEKLTKPLLEGNYVVAILAVGLIIPIFEEIFFRGIIFNELRGSMPVAVAVIIQAIIFAAFHVNPLQASYTFIIGILFALAYIWLKSIWAPIALHIFFNSTSIIIDRLINKQILDEFSAVFITISFIAFMASYYFIWKNRVMDNKITQIPLN